MGAKHVIIPASTLDIAPQVAGYICLIHLGADTPSKLFQRRGVRGILNLLCMLMHITKSQQIRTVQEAAHNQDTPL